MEWLTPEIFGLAMACLAGVVWLLRVEARVAENQRRLMALEVSHNKVEDKLDEVIIELRELKAYFKARDELTKSP